MSSPTAAPPQLPETTDPVRALTERPWIDRVDPRSLALLKASKAKGLNHAEVGMFLELSRSLGMNPWTGDIWAAKSQGRDGQEGRVLIMVGRDGLLGHAERNFDDYQGYDCGVLYENDHFERTDPDPEAKTMRARAGVVHRQGHPKERGKCVGAWAVAERAGRPPRYFFAELDQYMPKNEKKRQYSPWGSTVDVMIEKVPISVVHRTLCGLSGVYLEEEVAHVFDADSTAVEVVSEADLATAVERAVPEGQREVVLAAILEMSELAPNSWSPSKVEMTFAGKDVAGVAAEVGHIRKAVEELRARPDFVASEEPPEEADAEEGQASAEQPEDADVVQEPSEEEARLTVLRLRLADLTAALDGDELTEDQRAEALAEAEALREQLPDGDGDDLTF